MQPIFVDPDQVQVQGVVVGVMRKYWFEPSRS